MMHLHFRRKTCGNHPYHLHTRQAGRAIAQCLTGRKSCAIDPDKTEDGNYISAYACDPHTADAEFLLSKRQHKQLAGRTQYSNVIAYQVRQSFRPGEIPPEEPNQVGDEFLSRFLQGQHAFIVATHTDRVHIHNDYSELKITGSFLQLYNNVMFRSADITTFLFYTHFT